MKFCIVFILRFPQGLQNLHRKIIPNQSKWPSNYSQATNITLPYIRPVPLNQADHVSNTWIELPNLLPRLCTIVTIHFYTRFCRFSQRGESGRKLFLCPDARGHGDHLIGYGQLSGLSTQFWL